MRPFRFGVQAWTADSRRAWADQARQAADLGYSTLFLPDHLGDQLAPVPAMVAAADAAPSLRVGTLVYANDFRHPLVLATEAATMALLTDGRLELGIGAGWNQGEYDEAGIAFAPAGERISRLEDTIALVRRRLGDACPPLLVGGGGRRVLTLAARESDIVGVTMRTRPGAIDVTEATAASTDEKTAWVREAAGERLDRLELTMIVTVVVTDDLDATAERVAKRLGITPEEVAESPHVVFGSVEKIADDLVARRERYGISYWVTYGLGIAALAPVVARLAGA